MFNIKSQDCKIVKEYKHFNCGTYAVKVEDMKGRYWIVPPEDIEEPEFTVDTEHINTRPMIDENLKYEKFN